MDYRNTYSYFLNATESRLNAFVKNQLIKSKKKGRSFQFIDALIEKEFKARKAKRKNPWGDTLDEVNKLITFKRNYYEKYALQRILSNEALAAFEKHYSKKNYRKFLAFLGMETGLENSYYHYGLNRDYTEVLYKADELSFFTLREIPGGYSGLEHYYKVKTMVYGKDKVVDQLIDIETRKKTKHPLEDHNSPILDNDEKLYLLNLLFNYPVSLEKGYSFTEFARLMHLTSSSMDKKILSKTAGKVYTYQKLTEGIDMKKAEGINNKIFIEDLIAKISELELPETLRILQKKRAEIK